MYIVYIGWYNELWRLERPVRPIVTSASQGGMLKYPGTRPPQTFFQLHALESGQPGGYHVGEVRGLRSWEGGEMN